MNDRHDRVSAPPDDEAIDWAIRMGEPDADWDAFNDWLEGDTARSERYDRAVSNLRDAEDALRAMPTAPARMPANDSAEPLPGRSRGLGRWLGGAVAAALIGGIGMGVWQRMPRPYAIETAAGERRAVTLADGSSIVLAGGSLVRLDHADPRVATVERGEMLFRVRHDASHPFAVSAGDLELVDLGTVFDVKVARAVTRVAVAEGAVMVDPGGAAVRLDPGQAVVADGASLRREQVDPADVGGWQAGRLAFDGATLEEVAADLSRELGRPVRAIPAVARRTFRGTLDIRAIRDRPALLGSLLDVDVRDGADGWSLKPR